ncbi:2S seed storage protein-like [Macadamia integrifolia]|uniref:2S seed storage protein-like n=1 Tax=Macadamia integrifolia TaxID=60698 RepID=UPI001C52737F|nr:2S seed storage protein-like [Macadamia integrifolia]
MAEAYREDYQYSGDRRRCESSGRRVQSCQRYLQGGRKEEGLFPLPLPIPLPWPFGGGGESQDQSLGDCCRELRQVEDRCRCQAIEQALNEAKRQQQYQGQRGGSRYEQYGGEMIQRAQNLPNACRLDRPQYCEIRAY